MAPEEPDQESGNAKNFHEMGLDDRLLKAIAKMGWLSPTLIQEKAIPLVIEGKDVLMKARTGSGKTGAFGIPAIQKILHSKELNKTQLTRALILAPSKELCRQIHANLVQYSSKCSKDITVVDIAPQLDLGAQRPLLIAKPDIVVSTPARALLHLNNNSMKLNDSLELLVIDEADLVFSFGHGKDITELTKHLPRFCQTVLASATLSEDVMSIKSLFLHNAVTLKLQEPEIAPISQLTHYKLMAEEEEKATILYAVLKLKLIRGKTIIFVKTVDKSYKLKLFLEQFAIPTCVLNSELPATTRCHTVLQFNQGKYDVIIASDEQALEETSNKNFRRKKDKESGVVRGIDFQFVSNILNFDFPLDITSYIHRAGRTARGVSKGTAISFISAAEMPLFESVDNHFKEVFSRDESIFQQFYFKLEEAEGFRYRSKDAWRSVTKIAVREARLKEIKQEICNNQKLKGFFDDNPNDLRTLRHDKALHTVKVQPHLAHVPDYLIPPSLKGLTDIQNTKKVKRKLKPQGLSNLKLKAKMSNPLRTFGREPGGRISKKKR